MAIACARAWTSGSKAGSRSCSAAAEASAAGSPRRWRARAPGWRSRAAPRETLERAAGEIEGDVSAVRRRHRRPRARSSACPSEVARRSARSRSWSRTPAARRPGRPRRRARRLARGLRLADPRPASADRRRRCPGMRERGWGRIVNVGSSSTREPIGGLTLSNAHRPGLVGYLKTLAREVAADGVTVNDVATGRFATDRLAANWGGWEEMEKGAAADVPAGTARAARTSTATWSPSCAPSARPTSPGRRSRSTAAWCARSSPIVVDDPRRPAAVGDRRLDRVGEHEGERLGRFRRARRRPS